MNMALNKRKKLLSILLSIAVLLLLLPARAQAVRAVYSTQTLVYNGNAVSLDAYNIEGYTYFRLRDLAALLSGSIHCFSLEADEQACRVDVTRFEKTGGTPTVPGEDLSLSCAESAWTLSVDGNMVDCKIYNIGGHNFFRLRDLACALGFCAGYDADAGQVLLYAEALTGSPALEGACFQALALLYGGQTEAGITALARAAQDGSARAAYELAEGYYYGSFGLPQSYAKAAQYAKAAADGENPRGQYLYGLLLWTGQGIKQDKTQALSLFACAAQAGNIQAQSFLGACLYEEDTAGQDDMKAAAFSKAAADFGDVRAAYTYGRCLYHGRGTAKNYVAAVQYFQTAAQGGLADAVHALGVCYYEGTGVCFNPYIALYYFELAAGMGNAASAYNAGICYAEGVGTQADAEKAAEYMRSAAEAGIAQAAGWLEKQETPETKKSP